MKTYLTVAMVIVFGSMALTSCERKNKVAAAGEDSDTYQPLLAQDPGLNLVISSRARSGRSTSAT